MRYPTAGNYYYGLRVDGVYNAINWYLSDQERVGKNLDLKKMTVAPFRAEKRDGGVDGDISIPGAGEPWL